MVHPALKTIVSHDAHAIVLEKHMDALELMTHDDDVPYMEYVAKLKDNSVAHTVKLADLRHNSDLTRLDFIDDTARERVEKYAQAISLLEN